MILAHSPCTNARELAFGPDNDVRVAFDKAPSELVSFPSDSALIELLAKGPASGPGRGSYSVPARVALAAASASGTLLHNRRIRGCADQLIRLAGLPF